MCLLDRDNFNDPLTGARHVKNQLSGDSRPDDAITVIGRCRKQHQIRTRLLIYKAVSSRTMRRPTQRCCYQVVGAVLFPAPMTGVCCKFDMHTNIIFWESYLQVMMSGEEHCARNSIVSMELQPITRLVKPLVSQSRFWSRRFIRFVSRSSWTDLGNLFTQQLLS